MSAANVHVPRRSHQSDRRENVYSLLDGTCISLFFLCFFFFFAFDCLWVATSKKLITETRYIALKVNHIVMTTQKVNVFKM